MSQILVVEDEVHLAEGVAFNLEAEGHEVTIAADGRTAVYLLTQGKVDFELMILDLMLPQWSGFEVARRVRVAGNFLPILILTAKDDAQDLVRGLEEGADDYLTKPFRLDELLARVRGLLRRQRWDGVDKPRDSRQEVTIGESTVYLDRFELDTPGGTIALTTREMGLLRALIDRDGAVVSRGELLEEVWGLRPDTNTRVVDSFVVRLRRYLEPDSASPTHIVSVRGAGYRLLR
jgi:DNA-binding response OmpR family regulator